LLCIIAVSVILLFNFSYREAGKRVKNKIDTLQVKAQKKSVRKNDYVQDDLPEDRFSIRHKKVKMYDEQLNLKKSKSSTREVIDDIDDLTESPLSFEANNTVPISSQELTMPDTFEQASDINAEINTVNAVEDSAEVLPPEFDADENKPNDGSANVSAEFNTFDLPEGKKAYTFPPISLLSPAKASKNAATTNVLNNVHKLLFLTISIIFPNVETPESIIVTFSLFSCDICSLFLVSILFMIFPFNILIINIFNYKKIQFLNVKKYVLFIVFYKKNCIFVKNINV
jgi:hypothetical protein